MARTILKILLGALLVAFPFWAFFGLTRFGLVPVALGLLLIAALRLVVSFSKTTLLQGAFVLALALLAILFRAERAVLLYPVFMNAFFLFIFASSLLPGSIPAAERFARLKEKNLPPEGVRWCRGVTMAWCVFFLLNGGIALWTVFLEDKQYWTLWNGFASYIAIGLMFAAEYALRRLWMRKKNRANGA